MAISWWIFEPKSNIITIMHTDHCTMPGTSVWISFYTKPEVDQSPNFTLPPPPQSNVLAGKTKIHVLHCLLLILWWLICREKQLIVWDSSSTIDISNKYDWLIWAISDFVSKQDLWCVLGDGKFLVRIHCLIVWWIRLDCWQFISFMCLDLIWKEEECYWLEIDHEKWNQMRWKIKEEEEKKRNAKDCQ